MDIINDQVSAHSARKGEAHAAISSGPVVNDPGYMPPKGYWTFGANDKGGMVAFAPLDGSGPVVIRFSADESFTDVAQRLAASGHPALEAMFGLVDRSEAR